MPPTAMGKRWTRTFAALLVATLAASCQKKQAPEHELPSDAVMLPGSSSTIQSLFERLKPAFIYESVSIDHDHVLAHVCAQGGNPCFDVRLDPPRSSCAGQIAGPFCVVFPNGAPPAGAREALEASAKQADWLSVWASAEKRDKTTWQERVRLFWAKTGGVYLTPERAGLVVFLFFSLIFLWRQPDRATSSKRTLSELFMAAALAVVAYYWLKRLNVSNEGNEVFLTAIECETVGTCYTAGPGSSVLFYNGAVWPEILLIIRLFGGTPDHAHRLALFLMAISPAVLFLVLSRFSRPTLGLTAGILAVALLGARPIVAPVLDNSMTVISCFGVALGLFVYVVGEDPWALFVAGLFEAHAFNTHVSGISLIPAVLFIPAIAGRPWKRGIWFAASGFFVSSFMTSAAELAGNWVMAYHAHLLWPGLLSVGFVVAAGALLNRRYQQLTLGGRLAILALALILPHGAGMAALVIIKHPVLPGYLPPLVAPLAGVGAFLIVKALDWLPVRGLRILLPLAASALLLNHTHVRETRNTSDPMAASKEGQ